MKTDRYDTVFPWSGPWSASVVHNSKVPRGPFRTTAFSAAFAWSGAVVRNCFGQTLRTMAEKAVVRVVPYRVAPCSGPRTTQGVSRPEGRAA
jgi:hypothetical protein